MAVFSFKSAGKTSEDRAVEELVQSPTPIGIKTPLRFGNQEGILAMHYSLEDQVHDNLRNLILCNWGERLGFYDLGANLRPLTSEFVSQDDFDTKAIERISAAVQRWMPYITLETFESNVDRIENKNTAIVRITLIYSIPALKVARKSLQVSLYVI